MGKANPGAQRMKRSASRGRLRQLEDLFRAGTAGDLTDGELLDRFVRCRDGDGDSAFTALVERHGPMVFRVCMQTLDNPHAAEDATQATFLVLARQAGAIRKRPSVSSWLFGVARRASARIRTQEAQRRRHESRLAERLIVRPADPQELPESDPYPELHAEIERLPENYRLPIVLCYFEGLTHEQAASRLRWPLGTLKTRLLRARDRLRSRLERRGRPFLILLPADPLRPGILAGLPERLVNMIVQTGCRYATKGIAGGLVSSTIIEITREIMKGMLMSKLKSGLLVTAGLCLLGFGALVTAQQATGKGRATTPNYFFPSTTSEAPPHLQLTGATEFDPATMTTVRSPFDCRVDRVLVDLGATVKPGDPLLELFAADLAAAKSDYEVAVSQWSHDKKIHDYKKPLANNNAIPVKEFLEIENALAQSQLKMKLAREKLLIHGLTEQEIENVKNEDGVQKAKMILRARADGVVIKRDLVPGNYYDSRDALLTIASLDHLWVTLRAAEQHISKVSLGQDLTLFFPFSDQRVKAKVIFIDPRVAPDHTMSLRTTIPNADHRFKPGMFVRAELETEARHDRIDTPRSSGEPSRRATINDRLSELERKLDRLLGDDEEPSSNAKILERLDALERKVDQLFDAQKRKAP
jgi:RNA polymerase sigma factor (sigma-70 family)